jgi:hypothetical protein
MGAAPAGPRGSSLIADLEQQLGLKLVPVRAWAAHFIVRVSPNLRSVGASRWLS